MADQSSNALKRKADEISDQNDEFISDFSTIIKITLKGGTEKDVLTVHKNLIVKNSKYFRDRANLVDSIEVDKEEIQAALRVYLKYLYTGERDLRVLARRQTGVQECDGKEAVANIATEVQTYWQYGLALGDVKFMNDAMDALLRLTPEIDLLDLACPKWLRGSALHNWYITSLAYSMQESDVTRLKESNQGPDLVTDVQTKMIEVRDEKKGRTGPSIHKKSGYHVKERFLSIANQSLAIRSLGLSKL